MYLLLSLYKISLLNVNPFKTKNKNKYNNNKQI